MLYNNIIGTSDTQTEILNSIADIVMGQSPKSDTYNTSALGLPLLNGAADFRGTIAPTKWTSDSKKIVNSGSYIFGVRATIGLTTKVFDTYAIGRGTGSATAIRPYFDEFLYFVLEDLFDFYSKSASGTVYVNLSKKDFESYKFKLPDREQIKKYHYAAKPIMELVHSKNDEITSLQTLRDILLPKLMSGEFSVSSYTTK